MMGRARALARISICLVALVLAAAAAGAQNRMPRVYGAELEAHWVGEGTRFWYRVDGPAESRAFVLVDAEAGTRLPAFDHAAVAAQMGADVKPTHLPVESLELVEDGTQWKLVGKDGSWLLTLATGDLQAVADPGGGGDRLVAGIDVRPSRDGGPESSVTFENALARDVELLWIDTGGAPVSYGTLKPGERREQHTFAGHVWQVLDGEGANQGVFLAGRRPGRIVLDGTEPVRRSRGRRGDRGGRGAPRRVNISPDGTREAFVRDDDLWLRVLLTGEEIRLTEHGTPENSFHRDAIRARAVGMSYGQADHPPTMPEVHWSPDSRRLVALKTTVVPEPHVTLVESAPKDQVQPKVHTYSYIKPGDPIPQQRPFLFDAEAGREIPVDDARFRNPWSVGRFRWKDDGSRFTFLFNERGHQTLRLLAVDTTTGEVTTIVDETSETFVDYSQKSYLRFLEGTDELIWMSERDGWNHLYLIDATTGEVLNRITTGEWVVRQVEQVDEEARKLWFRACGVVPGQDPYYVHLFRVGLDGTGLTQLTAGDGTHEVDWSPDRRFLIDTWSRVDLPPVHELRRGTDGSLVCRLEEADASELLAAGATFPERFTAKGRDGVTDIYGVIHRPRDFDPAMRYAVVENIYAGPHGAFVPKSFRTRYRHQQEIVDEGFVVVQIDGMGTNWRSRAFHDVSWKNIADAGFLDRIAWMKAAAATRPYLDIERVGIYGGSAGGQNAMRAVLDHGGFYDAAAADCGCHDNRMDKIWWNEAWMGWPVDESYAKSSNVVDAKKLNGALLLTVGELDRNVDPASTMQVVNALRAANKDFELMVFPGGGHGSGESDYGRRLRREFFLRHLGGPK